MWTETYDTNCWQDCVPIVQVAKRYNNLTNSIDNGSSPNFYPNIKRIEANVLTSISPEIIKNLFPDDSRGRIEVNSLKIA